MSRKNRFAIPVATGLVALALLAGPGCSKSNSPTQPGGGGGGVESFSSGNFNNGTLTTTFVHTFNTAGDYGYYCTIHGTPTSGMRGTVHVDAAAPDSVVVSILSLSFSPTPANVKPGGYVHWIATTGTTHNVTR